MHSEAHKALGRDLGIFKSRAIRCGIGLMQESDQETSKGHVGLVAVAQLFSNTLLWQLVIERRSSIYNCC